MKQKLLCLLLCISMVVPSLPAKVRAAEVKECDHFNSGEVQTVSQNSVCELCETEEEETEKEQQPEEKEKKFQNDSGEVSQNDVLKKEEEKSQIVKEEQEENSSSTGDSAGNSEYKEDEQASLSQNSQPSVSGNGSDHGDDLQNTDQEIREEVITLTIEHKGLGSVYDVIPRRMGFFSLRRGNSWDSTSNTYYGQLDDESKAVYDILKAAYQNGGKAEAVSLNLDQELTDVPEGGMTQAYQDQKMSEVANIVNYALLALIYDHPEISWLVNTGGGTSVGFSSRTLGNTTTYHMTNVVYTMGNGSNTQFTKGQLDKAVADAMTEINTSLQQTSNTTYDKVKVIHDYICNNVSYVPPGQSLDDDKYQTVHSALLDSRVTVCAGYAKAFKVLCNRYGIPCILVSGQGGTDGKQEEHMWNYVKLGVNWYGVDCTWDDQGTDLLYDFFLAGGDTVAANFNGVTFSGSHTSSGQWSNDIASPGFVYPELSATEYAQSADAAAMSTVYISNTGADTNSGESDKPVKTLEKALEKVKEGGTIVIQNSVSITRPTGDLAITIEKPVTIRGGELTTDYGGIILGADVGFENITVNLNNAARNVIVANGYTLTLNSVVTGGIGDVKVFAGAITEGQNPYPLAGNKGRVIVKGTGNVISDIYAGNISDLGAYTNGANPTVESHFPGDVEIIIENGTTGTFGEIYAYGARENREGGSPNGMWEYDNPQGIVNIEDMFTIKGTVNIQLNGSQIKKVSGAADKKAHVTINSSSLIPNLEFSRINTLTVNGNIQPISLDDVVNIILNSGARLDLSELSGGNLSVNNFTGVLDGNIPGIIILEENYVNSGTYTPSTLTILGTVKGKTEFRTNHLEQPATSGMVKEGHKYIIGTSQNNGQEFVFNPYSSQNNLELQYKGGFWVIGKEGEVQVVKPVSFTIPNKTHSITKTNLNQSGISIPVNFDFGSQKGYGSDVPLEIKIGFGSQDNYTGSLVDTNSGNVYCVNALRMGIYVTESSDGQDILCVGKCTEHSHTDIASGKYTINITLDTQNGKVTETITLTVTDEQPGTTSKTQLSQGSLSLKSGVSYTYDGTAKTPSLSQLNLSVNGTSVSLDSNNFDISYSNNTNAGTATVTITAKATNTSYEGSVTCRFTINKASLKAQVNSKTLTYGQSFSLAGNNVTYSGFKGNDTANTALSGGTINFSTTYRQYQDVGTYTLTADVSNITSANYNITVKPGTLTVTALPVTLSWNNTTGRTYNDGKKVTASVTNLVNGDQVQVRVTGGEETVVGTHTATASALTGAKAKNYTLNGITKTKTYQIAKAAAPSNVAAERNVKWSQGGNQTFTLSDFSLPSGIKNAKITAVQKNSETVDSQNIFTGTASVANGTVTIPLAKAASFAEGNKGIYDVTITSDTHEDIHGEITIIIVDKEVADSLISLTVENITYGELPSPKGSFSGTKGNHVSEVYTYSTDGLHYKTLDELKNSSGWLDAGTYDVHYTYSDDGQIGTKIAAFEVEKKELTPDLDVASVKKEYDGTTKLASGQNPVLIVKGAVSGENPVVDGNGILFSYENSTAGTDKVIKVTGITLAEGNAVNRNYLISDSASSKGAVITPKSVTVSPKASYTKQYGAKDPVLEYTVVGLLDSDVLEGTLKRAIGENVGSFSYDVSSLKNSNYTVKLDDQASYFTITKAEADIFVSADVVNQKPGSKVAVTVVAKNKKALEIAGATQPKSVVVDGVIFKAKEDGVFEGDYTIPSTAKAGDIITLKAKINDSNYLADKEAEVTITVSERETTALPVPGELDGKSYRLAMEQGISKVPDALKNHDTLNTVDKILNALKVEVKKQDGKITDGNTVTYDVILWYNNDNGKSWIKADATHWPKEGTITVTLPYPAGTSKNTHNFKVTHMFTVNMNGKQAGTFEYPIPVKTDQGIEFKVSGLSPITLGWSQIETTSQENQGGGSQGGNSQGGESSTTAAQTKKENKTEEKPVEVNKQNATESSGTKRTPAKQSGSKTNKVEVREEPQTQVAKAEEEKETGSVNEEDLTEASGEKESEGVEEAAEETEEAASAVEVKEKSSIGIWIALAIAVIAAAGILILVIKRKQEDTE